MAIRTAGPAQFLYEASQNRIFHIVSFLKIPFLPREQIHNFGLNFEISSIFYYLLWINTRFSNIYIYYQLWSLLFRNFLS